MHNTCSIDFFTIPTATFKILFALVILSHDRRKHLNQILTSYFEYYHYDRTHCGLDKDTPIARPVQPKPANCGKVIELPRVGGLHHRYEWRQVA
jgi:hypothetical protein